jgi:hypothetical protein
LRWKSTENQERMTLTSFFMMSEVAATRFAQLIMDANIQCMAFCPSGETRIPIFWHGIPAVPVKANGKNLPAALRHQDKTVLKIYDENKVGTRFEETQVFFSRSSNSFDTDSLSNPPTQPSRQRRIVAHEDSIPQSIVVFH